MDDSELYRWMAEASASGVLVVAADGRIVVVNRQIEQQFGYSRAALIGQPVEMLVPEARDALQRAHGEAFMRAPGSRPMGVGRELQGRREDGTEIPLEIGFSPVQTPHGSFLVVTVVDLTERRRLERANHAALEARLQFEQLLAELSATFINLPHQEVETAIGDAQRQIGQALDVDRVALWRLDDSGDLVRKVTWTAPGLAVPAPGISARESLPWLLERIRAGEVVAFATPDELPDVVDRATHRRFHTRSSVAVPLTIWGRLEGAAMFDVVRGERRWTPEIVGRLRLLGSVFGNVLARQRSDDVLLQALLETERLRDHLRAENVYLRHEVKSIVGTDSIVGESPAVRQILERLEQVAATDATVLLLGETGTGKELFASYIHESSARRDRAMVRVNCSSIPASLIESELFGREKGAYTGALSRQIGRFELADKSTIFLDEVGELPPDVQVKLLRVLEDRHIERLGSPNRIKVDMRIVAATNRDLDTLVAEGAFREDLYYRLNVFPIRVPPLRERVDDIPLLVWRFVDEFSRAFGKRIESISGDNMEALKRYPWPGNVRELRNVVERSMIGATSRRLTITLPQRQGPAAQRSETLADVERQHILGVLELTRWRIRGEHGAAARLGLKPTTLETRMAKLGLRRPRTVT